TGVPSERRPQRLASPTPDDNRVTHGCINVAPDFYEQVVAPAFEKGGVFYILPDKEPLEETFPEFVESRASMQDGDGKLARSASRCAKAGPTAQSHHTDAPPNAGRLLSSITRLLGAYSSMVRAEDS